MATLDLTPDELLSTTRAVRKRLDLERPVEPAIIRECIELAVQAPTASNEQGWHFMVVTDEAPKVEIARYYRQAWENYRTSDSFSAFRVHADEPSMHDTQQRMVDGVEYLADILHRVPALVIPCVRGRVEAPPSRFTSVTLASTYGSILPATWSFMLAARARGLGTSFTTLHLFFEREIAELLEVPYDEYTQVALLPLAHTIGTDFKPGPRRPIDPLVHFDRW